MEDKEDCLSDMADLNVDFNKINLSGAKTLRDAFEYDWAQTMIDHGINVCLKVFFA